MYTVSQKTIPAIIDCSLKKDYQILIIFDTNISDTTGQPMTVHCSSSHLTQRLFLHYLGKTVMGLILRVTSRAPCDDLTKARTGPTRPSATATLDRVAHLWCKGYTHRRVCLTDL